MMDKKNFLFKVYPVNKNINKQWFVQVKNADTGRIFKKYGKLAHCATVAEKEREAKKIISEFLKENGSGYTAKGRNKVLYALSKSLEVIEARLTQSSYHNYFSVYTRFCTWYRQQPKENPVHPGGYILHLQKSGLHKNYIRKQKNIIQQIFKEASWAGYNENPFANIVTKKIKSQSLLPYSRQQLNTLKDLIEHTNPGLWFACEFLFYLYFRPDELRRLKIKHILFDENKIAVTADLLKDNDVYFKNIPEQLRYKISLLQNLDPEMYIFSKGLQPGKKMLGYNTIRHKFLKYRRAANLSDRYGLYSFVHTGIKMAVLANVPIKQLQLQKGHSDLQMFDEYLKNLGLEDFTALQSSFPTL